MTYRLPQLKAPIDDPFKHDVLERIKIVEFLSGVVERSGKHPVVLAIDAPYGSGKSTFVDMMRATLEKKNFQTVYFDAWRADHVNDPLVAMVAALDEVMPKTKGTLKTSLGVVRRVATTVAKRGAVAAVKVATVGALDLEDEVEEILRDAAGEASNDLIGEFQRKEKLISCFREALGNVVKQLAENGKQETLVFFIDELDRCRPDFAISLLERVKHMFDVPNIVFVLSVDKTQLEAVTAAIYGERINAAEYLRKFIDLEFGLPAPVTRTFLNSAISRAGLDDMFEARASHPETRADREHIVNIMFALAKIFDLSLRTQERCITRLKLVLEQTQNNHYLDPEHVGLLIILRLVDQRMYGRVVSGTASPDEVIEFLVARPMGRQVLESEDGRILRALIFAEDRDNARRMKRIADMQALLNGNQLSEDEFIEVSRQIDLIRDFSNRRGRRPGRLFEQAAQKIDIASQLRE